MIEKKLCGLHSIDFVRSRPIIPHGSGQGIESFSARIAIQW